MADGNTVDSLQIEIEAASSEAEKKVDALAAALERLKKTTTGFGNVSNRIKDIGASANEAPAAEKTRKRKEALDRATGLTGSSKNGGFKADKISRELNRVDKEIEKTTEKLLYLQEKSDDLDLFRGVGSIESQSEASSKIKDIEYQLDQYSKLQDSLDAQRRSLLKSLEGENNQPIKENIDSGSIDEATKKVNSLKQAIKELDRGKLQLTNELAKAEIQAVKTDGKLADLRRKIDGLKEKDAGSIAKNALQDAEDRFSKFSDAAAKTKEKIETLQKALEILNSKKIDLSAPGMEDEIRESSQELKRLIQLYRDANNAAKLAGEEMKNSMAAVNAAMKSSAGKATKGKAAKEKNIIGRPEDSGVEQVESETSLQKKLGIIQRISEALAKMKGQKLNIGSVEGLKGLLRKDLSLQSLIPKGAEAGIKALEGALGGLKEKMLGIAAAHPILAAALVGVNVAAKTVGKAVQSFAQTAASAAKKGFELLAAGAKKLASALGNLVRAGISKAAAGLKSLAKSIGSRFTAPFRKAIEQVSRWKKMLGSAIFYSTVFRGMSIISNGLKEGITNLYEYSRLIGTEFAPAMNSLATSALYLKNSLGAMAAPLIQALAPAVDFLIDKFVALINVIGKAFAMLTGKSVYTQAKKHAVEYGEAANAASKATQKFLLGIDELTILENPAGGAGSAIEDYGSMFEEVEIDQDQFDWVKQIREAIEKGEWRSVGELVADKLNEIVDSWDSYAWGKKLGELINNGLNVAYGFLKKFDFENLGLKVADFFNGIFDSVDWDLAGRTFAAGWNGLMEFIYGLITGFHWDTFGKAIADAIIGFFSEIDWELPIKILQAGIEAVRQAFVGFLSEFGEKLDIKGITDPLIEIVNTVAGTLQKLIEDTKTWFGQLDFTPLITAFENLLSAISPFVSAVSEGLLWAFENVLLPFGKWVAESGLPSAINYIAESIEKITKLIKGDTTLSEFIQSLEPVEKIILGVTAALGVLKTAFDIGSIVLTAVEHISTISAVIGALASPLGIAVVAVGALVSGFTLIPGALDGIDFEPISEAIKNLFEAISPLVDIISDALMWAFENVLVPLGKWIIEEAAPASVNALAEAFEAVSAIINVVVDVIKSLYEILKPVISFIGETAIKIIQVLGDIFSKIADVFNEKGEKIVHIVDEVGKIIQDVWGIAEPILTAVRDTVGAVFQFVGDIVATTIGAVIDVLDGILTFLDGVFSLNWEKTWTGISDVFKGIWNGIVGFAEGAVNFLIRALNGFIRGLNKIQVPDWVPLIGGKGFNISEISEIKIPRLESGGMLEKGQMFIAREAGPELVGQIGNRTAVANNEQIISGIAAGVADANTEFISVFIGGVQQIVAAINENGDRPINLDWASMASGMTTMQNRQNMMYGRTLQNA